MDASGTATTPTSGAQVDAQLAAIFVNMRRMLNLPIDRLARVFGMPEPVIRALEAGRIDQLPNWAETIRVVQCYAEAVGVDPAPIFARLERHRGPIDQRALARATQRTQTAQPNTAAPTTATVRTSQPATGKSALSAERRQRRRRRRAFAIAVVALIGGPFAIVQLVPGYAYLAARRLPDLIGAPIVRGLDFLVFATAPQHDGLRWIDVGDPRMRKADRLPSGQR